MTSPTYFDLPFRPAIHPDYLIGREKPGSTEEAEHRKSTSALYWLFARTITGHLGPSDQSSLRGPVGQSMIFDVGARIFAHEMAAVTEQEEIDFQNGYGQADGLDDLREFVAERNNSLAGAPLNNVIVKLGVSGNLDGAKLVDRRQHFKNVQGRVLKGGILMVRESASMEELLRAAKHHGAHAICFVQAPEREGPNGIFDTTESVKTPDQQKTPAALRLSIVEFGNAEAVGRALDLYVEEDLREQRAWLDRLDAGFKIRR